jgi:hypothetical protein
MTVTILLSLVVSIAKDAIIYFIGKLLQQPFSLRSYLGIQNNPEEEPRIIKTGLILGYLGIALIFYALADCITSLVSTIIVLTKLN